MDQSRVAVIVPLLVVVRRGATHTFRLLEEEFAGEPVRVLWDRRVGERRQTQTSAPERRQRDRRRAPPRSWTAADFVVAQELRDLAPDPAVTDGAAPSSSRAPTARRL